MTRRYRVTLNDQDIAFIEDLLDGHADRMEEQQAATHDYTPDDMRAARRRRTRIRCAIIVKEDV